MPEKAEVLAMLLRILLFIICGSTRLKSIHNNLNRPKKNGQPMKMKQNSRRGSDKNVEAFLGDEGALVVGVEVEGNQLGMLLQNNAGDYRILRWNLRQGGALDWFVKLAGVFTKFPASSRTRNAACFEFEGLDLSDVPDDLAGGPLFLVQTDCTSTPNQSEWELQFVTSHDGIGFSPRPGWFARHRGVPSMLGDPLGWIAAVKASARAAAAHNPGKAVVIWLGTALCWEGTGFKTKSELLHRFARATAGCVFMTMGQLAANEVLVEHLCLCAYLLLSEELYFVQW